jgi:hypothetical protein
MLLLLCADFQLAVSKSTEAERANRTIGRDYGGSKKLSCCCDHHLISS